jgi:hypothetical protein
MAVKDWLRYMRTTQEKRRFVADAVEGVKLRARRNATNLVDAWDDLWRRPQKSWKSYRKTRWRREVLIVGQLPDEVRDAIARENRTRTRIWTQTNGLGTAKQSRRTRRAHRGRPIRCAPALVTPVWRAGAADSGRPSPESMESRR